MKHTYRGVRSVLLFDHTKMDLIDENIGNQGGNDDWEYFDLAVEEVNLLHFDVVVVVVSGAGFGGGGGVVAFRNNWSLVFFYIIQ